MNFECIDWADSNLLNINIEYDRAELTICNDTLQRTIIVSCSGLVGIDNLCIWDDMTIMNAEIVPISGEIDGFLEQVYAAYDKKYNYGGRCLDDGLLQLKIELSNSITFGVYCLKVDVIESVIE